MASKTPQQAPKKFAVLDGKLHIFTRPNTKNWWCGYHKNGVYVRATTKTADRAAAIEAAKEWYYIQQYELKNGVIPAKSKNTFEHYAKLALDDYDRLAAEGGKSPNYAKGLRMLLENSLVPFFGRYELKNINQKLWNQYAAQRLHPNSAKPTTIKHHLNGLRVVFRRAFLRGEIDTTPTFHTERSSSVHATPRTWFNEEEFRTLAIELIKNIDFLKKTRWESAALELNDYVWFMANTGLRVGEGKNLKFRDIKYRTENDETGVERQVLEINLVKGKRGLGGCKSHHLAVKPFERIVARRGLAKTWSFSDQPVFQQHHRDMFNEVLKRCDLKKTKTDPPLRRDLMSLRNTYICNRLIAGVAPGTVAKLCRTSSTMIEQHYARWLEPQRLNINMSAPSTPEQKRKKAEQALSKNMKGVMDEFKAEMDEIERQAREG